MGDLVEGSGNHHFRKSQKLFLVGVLIFVGSLIGVFTLINAFGKYIEDADPLTKTESHSLSILNGGTSQKPDVLGLTAMASSLDKDPNVTFNIDVLAKGDVDVKGALRVNGVSVFGDNINAIDKDIYLGSGKIFASNIIDTIQSTSGIKVTKEGSTANIENDGVLTLQGLTGNVTLNSGTGIQINGTTISAVAPVAFRNFGVVNDGTVIPNIAGDTLRFAEGPGIKIIPDQSTKTIMITSSYTDSGWIKNEDATVVKQTNPLAFVGLGTDTPLQKLDVRGSIRLGDEGAGNVLGSSTTGIGPTGSLYWGDRKLCDASGNCQTEYGDVFWGDLQGNLSDQADLQAALDAKQNDLGTGAINQYLRGDRTWQLLSTTSVAEGTNWYYTTQRFNTDFAVKNTDSLTEGVNNLYFTTGRARSALSVSGAGLSYNPLTGTVDLPAVSVSTNGYLTSTDWSRFDQAVADSLTTSGTTAQYLRGDRTWQDLNTDVVAEGTRYYYTSARFSADLATKTTDDLAEGALNKYYTQSRFDAAFAAKSTTNLAEGTNLYYTTVRFNLDFASKSTDSLTEGASNLYFSQARARNSLSSASPIQFNQSTGVISIAQANATTSGYLSTSDWVRFDAAANNSPYPAAGTASQYLRGDYTWQELNTSIVPEGTNLYYTDGRFDTRFATKSTTNLAEGTNLYYTQGRFDSAFSGKTTTNLAEGTNLYYTTVRFNTDFASKTTDNLNEGSTNLYFSESRARAAISSSGVVLYDNGTGVISVAQANTTTHGYLSSTDWNTFYDKQDALIFGSGLTITAGTVTNNLTTGVSGGQTIIGGTASGDDLTITSTSNVTKGDIILNPNGGKVGIGTATPLQLLDVAGSVRLGGAGANNVIGTTATVTNTSDTLYWSNWEICTTSGNCSGTGAGIGGSGTTNYIAKFSGTYNIMASLLYDDGTNVGIGTSSPSEKLDVSGAIRLGASGANNVLNTTAAAGAAPNNLYWGNAQVCIVGGSCSGAGAGVQWGDIAGTLSNQTDLQTALNGKEPTITAGTTPQYWRGDKTWQTLNTTAVVEGTNLYYTQGRFDSAFASKTTDNLSEGSTNRYFTDTRARNAVSASAPISYNSSTGVFSITAASSTTNGYLTSADWIRFDTAAAGELPASGTISQYLRGDRTWQTLDTSAVAEGANLYYTTARFLADFGTRTTDNLSEGTTNQYYTNSRFDTRFGTKTTSDLNEGANLYYTEARFDNSFGMKDTDALAEGLLNLYFTNARARSAISVTSPLAYNSSTGVISLPVASTTTDGYLTSADYTRFDSAASNTIPSGGTTSQYLRGDRTWQTLTSSVVSEGTNLYYTQARFNADFSAKNSDDLAEGLTNKYYTTARFNTDFALKTTTNLTEGTNLYYTDARARAAISVTGALQYNGTTGVIDLAQSSGTTDGYLSSVDWVRFDSAASNTIPSGGTTSQYLRGDRTWQTLSTSVVTEGSNLYYTTSRFDIDFGAKDTDDLTEGLNQLFFTQARARASVSAIAPLTYNSTTGEFNISQADGVTNGFLSSADWSRFDAASGQTVPTGGTITQYLRGDSTWQTLNTTAVAEGINQYFTNTRARAALSSTGAITYNSGTGAIGITQSSTTTDGYLSAADYSRFDAAASANLPAGGTATDYLRGDNTWQALNTTAVAEGTNLYYTDARFDTRFGTKTTADLTEGANLYYTDARSRAALSNTGPITYNSGTGAIGINQATGLVNGYLSSTDWTTFNNKQSELTFSSGLVNNAGTVTNTFATGLAGGQTIYGGTAVNEDLTIQSTSNATKGAIFLNPNGGVVSVNTTNESTKLNISHTSSNPMSGLNAYGGLHFIQPNADGYVGFTSNGEDSPSGNTQGGFIIQGSSAVGTRLHFFTSNNYAVGMQNRMTIDQNGYVGIGTASPVAKFQNTGSTLINVSTVSNLASGGALGTAANTVDAYTTFQLSQSTAGQTISLPTPTNNTPGRLAVLTNTGTTSFTFSGAVVGINESRLAVWTGATWSPVGDGFISAAGANTQIQFNNNGVMGASSNFVWDNTNSRLGIGVTPSYTLDVAGTMRISDSATFSGSAPQIQFANGTSNYLTWNNSGVAAPTTTSRSSGTKLVLYPNVSSTNLDFAIGIESSTLWYSVPTSGNVFKWYLGPSTVTTLNSTGLTIGNGSADISAGRLILNNSNSHNWGTSVIDGRVWSANSNIHLSPPNGFNVVIDTGYRDAGGSTGTAGLTASGNITAGGSLTGTIFYDANDTTNFYVDPTAVSKFTAVHSNVFCDRADTNYCMDLDGVTRLLELRPTQIWTPFAGGNSNISGEMSYHWGYQEGGAWAHPYPDLVLAYHTGVKIGGHYSYNGTRFYNDHPSRAGATEIFSVGNGDSNIRVNNSLFVGTSQITYPIIMRTEQVAGTYGTSSLIIQPNGANASYPVGRVVVDSGDATQTYRASVFQGRIGGGDAFQVGATTSMTFLDSINQANSSAGHLFLRFSGSFTNRFHFRGDGVAYSSGWGTPYQDFAEYYDSSEGDIKPGYLVRVNGYNRVSRSEGEYADDAIGIISTKPGFISGVSDIEGEANGVAVGTAGKLPAIVTTYNGAINTGDRITTSSITGVGMLSTAPGSVVAKAIEASDGWSAATCPVVSSINAIVWPADNGKNENKPCFRVPVSSLPADSQSRITTNDYIFVGKLMVYINISWYEPLISSNGAAGWTQSEGLLTSSYDIAVEGNISAKKGTFSEIATSVLSVANGAFKVDSTGKLVAQSGITSSNITTAVLTATDVTIQNLTVDTINAKKIAVGGALADEDPTVGTITIPQGDQKIVIPNKNITANSRVFITVTTEGGTYLVVSKKTAGEGFEVSAPSPVLMDTTFDYWIVGDLLP